jgi:hypothetical protein
MDLDILQVKLVNYCIRISSINDKKQFNIISDFKIKNILKSMYTPENQNSQAVTPDNNQNMASWYPVIINKFSVYDFKAVQI